MKVFIPDEMHRLESIYPSIAEIIIACEAEVNEVTIYGGNPPFLMPLDEAIKLGNDAVAEVLRLNGNLSYGAMPA